LYRRGDMPVVTVLVCMVGIERAAPLDVHG
jgi:hypothetical protein